MTNNNSVSGGRENRWPLGIDHRDPEAFADFGLSLGYDADDVVKTLVSRCNLDPITARRIVESVARNQGR